MKLRSVEIGEEYLVNEKGTSDGSQDKYYKDGIWYKTDHFGGEGSHEYTASRILSCSDLSTDDYVIYEQVMINGKNGCLCKSFLKDKEEYVSLYRLHQNIKGNDIAGVMQRMDFDDQAEYVTSFVKKETGVDIGDTLGNLFFLDYMILNEDRHMNNIGLIFDGNDYRPAPIFDNGKSFFCGNKKYDHTASIKDNIKFVHFKPFTATIEMMMDRFRSKMTIDLDAVESILESITDKTEHEVIKYRIKELRNYIITDLRQEIT